MVDGFGLLPQVVYKIKACKIGLPGVSGMTSAWAVVRFYGVVEGECVAVFAHGRAGVGKEMAEKYALYLMQTRTEAV